MNTGMVFQALMGLPMVCAPAFALVMALVAPRVPGRGLARWGAALMLCGQIGALSLSLLQMSLYRSRLDSGQGLGQVATIMGLANMLLSVVAITGICLLGYGFLRAARAAARAQPR